MLLHVTKLLLPRYFSNIFRVVAMEHCLVCQRPLVNGHNLRLIRTAIAASIGASALTGGLIGAYVLPYIGFTSAGVTAGSWAASVQAPITAAGSVFAICQYLGATGVGALLFGTVGSIGSAGTALYLLRTIADLIDFCTCV